MAWASKSYTFSPSTVASSSEVNQNFDDMVAGLNTAMPSGGIIMWSGSVGTIPAGWFLCDGSNSTPDLRGRFIIGAGGAYAVGATGGSATHDHAYSGTTSQTSIDYYSNAGDENVPTPQYTHTHTYSGTTASASSLPPYYALCFIMKS